jgi:hypothetical protein
MGILQRQPENGFLVFRLPFCVETLSRFNVLRRIFFRLPYRSRTRMPEYPRALPAKQKKHAAGSLKSDRTVFTLLNRKILTHYITLQ